MQKTNDFGLGVQPVLRQSAHCQAPTGARHCADGVDAIELKHDSQLRQASDGTFLPSLFKSPQRVSATSLTSWSSRRPQAPLVGALRASHSGAAYRGR